MHAFVTENKNEGHQRRWLIFIVLNIFTFMGTLDASIVNIALPTISKELGLAFANSQWIVISYLLTICTVILFSEKWETSLGKSKFLNGDLFCLSLVLFFVA